MNTFNIKWYILQYDNYHDPHCLQFSLSFCLFIYQNISWWNVLFVFFKWRTTKLCSFQHRGKDAQAEVKIVQRPRMVCIFHHRNLNIIFFQQWCPCAQWSSCIIVIHKDHCHTKHTTAATFSHDTLQTPRETLETNLPACVPGLETVKSSLDTNLNSSTSHSFHRLIDANKFLPARISCQNLSSHHSWGCAYFIRQVFVLGNFCHFKSCSQVKYSGTD